MHGHKSCSTACQACHAALLPLLGLQPITVRPQCAVPSKHHVSLGKPTSEVRQAVQSRRAAAEVVTLAALAAPPRRRPSRHPKWVGAHGQGAICTRSPSAPRPELSAKERCPQVAAGRRAGAVTLRLAAWHNASERRQEAAGRRARRARRRRLAGRPLRPAAAATARLARHG